MATKGSRREAAEPAAGTLPATTFATSTASATYALAACVDIRDGRARLAARAATASASPGAVRDGGGYRQPRSWRRRCRQRRRRRRVRRHGRRSGRRGRIRQHAAADPARGAGASADIADVGDEEGRRGQRLRTEAGVHMGEYGAGYPSKSEDGRARGARHPVGGGGGDVSHARRGRRWRRRRGRRQRRRRRWRRRYCQPRTLPGVRCCGAAGGVVQPLVLPQVRRAILQPVLLRALRRRRQVYVRGRRRRRWGLRWGGRRRRRRRGWRRSQRRGGRRRRRRWRRRWQRRSR